MVDINFIISDPRLDGMTAAARWIYLVLWVSAVKERRSTLPRYYLTQGSLARQARVDHRSIAPALAKLQQNCLISVDEENGITIKGVRNKHRNLVWKDDPISEDIETHKTPLSAYKKGKGNKKGKGKGKTPKPPRGPTPSSSEFETFWEAFPRDGGSRGGKPNAAKKWTGLMAEGATAESLTACMENYKKEIAIVKFKSPMAVARFLGPNREFEEYTPGKWKEPKPPTKAHEKPQVRGGVAFAKWDKDGKRIYEK